MMSGQDDFPRPVQAGEAPAAAMSDGVVQRLLDLNRRFYEKFASAFDETRGPQQAGLLSLVQRLHLASGASVLDVGCGNGRLAQLLDDLGLPLRYVGVDGSAGLLAAARRNTATLQHVQVSFLQLDVTKSDWTDRLPDAGFDCVTLLAVLHHIPGWRLRLDLLRSLKPLLDPGGLLALSTWQFLNSDRLRRKIVPWQALGLGPAQVEAGDYLLDWKRGGTGLRYCHHADRAELAALAAESGWHLLDSFRADGREGDLNLFALLATSALPERPEA
jgi:2-polyprenyl-3-methyl-5-hydroxy-6-metoxy-1,4-benzoquinol methylase